MISKTYTIDNHYEEWVKNNLDVEHLILIGELSVEEEDNFEKAFSEISFKSIDISNFSIVIEGKRYETCYDLWWNNLLRDEMFDVPCASTFFKVFANKEFSSSFHWENGFLLDESGTIVIDNASQCDTMEVPQGITVVGHFALSMRSFKTLILPDSLHTIGRCAFCDSYNLDFTEVFIPDSVKKIGEYAFDGCDLEKIHLPAYLETIPKGCFNHNCFTSIEWPQTLKHIEDKAFRCSDLEKIILPEGVEDVGYDVFEGHHLRISLPSTLKKIEKDFYYEECVDDPELCLPFIEVHPDNPYFFTKDGTLYSRDDADTPYLGYTYPEPKIKSNPEPDPCGDCSKCPYNREYDKEFIDESLDRFLEEAQNGDIEKQEVVAAMYATDRWIEHDYDKAFYWYSKAAQQGSSLAMEAIADAYYEGTWLEQDYGKAIEWLQKAADNGYAKAVNNLASCYEEGKGVEVDLERALQLYLQAAEMGYDTTEDVKRLQSCKEEKSID